MRLNAYHTHYLKNTAKAVFFIYETLEKSSKTDISLQHL